jgi:hypothetical protein
MPLLCGISSLTVNPCSCLALAIPVDQCRRGGRDCSRRRRRLGSLEARRARPRARLGIRLRRGSEASWNSRTCCVKEEQGTGHRMHDRMICVLTTQQDVVLSMYVLSTTTTRCEAARIVGSPFGSVCACVLSWRGSRFAIKKLFTTVVRSPNKQYSDGFFHFRCHDHVFQVRVQ